MENRSAREDLSQITPEEKIQILKNICELLEKNNLDYLVYGSMGYQLLTGDKGQPVRDIDIVVKQSDFAQLSELLPSLKLNPIPTPYTIHANSVSYLGEDGKPFDISFDSYEHYFNQHNINLGNYIEVGLEGVKVRVMKPEDLVKIYDVGLKGNNEEKLQEYQDKIRKLTS